MPTLNWIGKEAVVKHKDVSYLLLEQVAEVSFPSPAGGITSALAGVVSQPSAMPMPKRCLNKPTLKNEKA